VGSAARLDRCSSRKGSRCSKRPKNKGESLLSQRVSFRKVNKDETPIALVLRVVWSVVVWVVHSLFRRLVINNIKTLPNPAYALQHCFAVITLAAKHAHANNNNNTVTLNIPVYSANCVTSLSEVALLLDMQGLPEGVLVLVARRNYAL